MEYVKPFYTEIVRSSVNVYCINYSVAIMKVSKNESAIYTQMIRLFPNYSAMVYKIFVIISFVSGTKEVEEIKRKYSRHSKLLDKI